MYYYLKNFFAALHSTWDLRLGIKSPVLDTCSLNDWTLRVGVGKSSLVFFDLKRLLTRASQVAQMVKCLPAMWETWVQSLGQEDPLEEEMATHSSILAWRIPWTEEPGGL